MPLAQSLRTTTMSFVVVVSTPAWVPRTIFRLRPMPPSKPNDTPRVPHAGSVVMVGPGMKPKLAREPFLLRRVLWQPSANWP
jgi:hypothetical protein